MTQIANPIYDVVFKYLMEDAKVAKLLLSAIIGEEVEVLELLPQENTLELEKRSLTVYRLDFSAKIRTEEGLKNVIIEVQKAKFSSDIMRFRKYLGEQYRKSDLPIINIYFLGHQLDFIQNPFIKIKRDYYDGVTGEVIHQKEAFIESLSHDSFVIQVPYLKKRYRSELEALLSVFDQSNIASGDEHLLNIDENLYPEKYRELIRRLQRAVAEPDMRKKMDIEDEIIRDLEDLERQIEKQEQELHASRKTILEKEQKLQEREQTIHQNRKTIEEKDQKLHEKDQKLHEKDQKLLEQSKLIEELKKRLK